MRAPDQRRARLAAGTAALLALLAATLLAPPPVPAATYHVRSESSELAVLVFKAGFTPALGHDHVIHATRFSGTVSGDPADPARAEVVLAVQVDGLVPDESALRQRYGLAQQLSESDRRRIQATMLGDRQLDAARHPTIGFRSTAVERQASDRFFLVGDLTLHGTTRTLRIPVAIRPEAGGIRASGHFEINQSDYGIQPYSAFLGAVANQDRVQVRFDLLVTP